MDNRISPISFNGSWQILGKKTVADCLTSEGVKMVFHPMVYHPNPGESPAEIKAAMDKVRSGWGYSVWRLHPNGGRRNGGGIYELYAPKLGSVISENEADKFTNSEILRKIINIDVDAGTFTRNHRADSFRVFDVVKLSAERASELIEKYLNKAE